ncbi:MAG TPA: hypothetical protein VGC42_30800 [Kofleriaceae bacterium]
MTRGAAAVLAGWSLALAAMAINGCVVRRLTGPRLTGTCDGACDHYVECKPGHRPVDRERCVRECPDAFSDRDLLMAYESLGCEDAVEYVDGTHARTAKTSPVKPKR